MIKKQIKRKVMKNLIPNINSVKKNILVTIVFVLHMFVQSALWYFNNKSFNVITFIALIIIFDFITDKIEEKYDVEK
jgi:uncharacterized membrane protein